jgi:hypothetical protein
MTKNAGRRSGRISRAVPILLIGSDSEGTVFSEEAHTVVLSQHGAGIVSKHKLIAEQELILREMATSQEAEVRVVGEIAQQGAMHTYGVAFVDEALDFWKVEFPAAPSREERPAVLTLECCGCKGIVELANGDFEYDICAIHGGLPRYCRECGLLTVWRQSLEVMPTGPRVVVGARKAEAPKWPVAELEAATRMTTEVVPLAEAVDRRQRVRAKVNFFACVRSEEYGEDIVKCIDMSRGGVSFRSRNAYAKGTEVQIAVPYSAEVKEAPAIFVRARIANVKEMTGGGVYRCGAEFVKE